MLASFNALRFDGPPTPIFQELHVPLRPQNERGLVSAFNTLKHLDGVNAEQAEVGRQHLLDNVVGIIMGELSIEHGFPVVSASSLHQGIKEYAIQHGEHFYLNGRRDFSYLTSHPFPLDGFPDPHYCDSEKLSVLQKGQKDILEAYQSALFPPSH